MNTPKLSVLDRWNNFKRLLLVIFAVLMWIMSIVFSYMGFKSGVRSEWYFGLFALVLSGAITTMELYLNSQVLDFEDSQMEIGTIILWVGGIAAYAYGIWTNILGVSIMMIGSGNLTTVPWTTQVVPIIVGLLLEILPEPMLVAFFQSKKVAIPPDLARTQVTRSQIPVPTEIRKRQSVITPRPESLQHPLKW